MNVWDRAGIELATPGSEVRLASVAIHVTDCATRLGTSALCVANMGGTDIPYMYISTTTVYNFVLIYSARVSIIQDVNRPAYR